MKSLRLFAVDPRAAAALADAEAARVLALVRDDEEHVFAVRVAEVVAGAFPPLEFVAPCDLGELSR